MASIPAAVQVRVEIDDEGFARVAGLVKAANSALDGCADATRAAVEAVRELESEVVRIRALTASSDEEGCDGS